MALSIPTATILEVSETTNSSRPRYIWALWILGTCKTYGNHITFWIWHNNSLHPFIKIILDNGKSNLYPCFSKKNPLIDKLFFLVAWKLKLTWNHEITKFYTNPPVETIFEPWTTVIAMFKGNSFYTMHTALGGSLTRKLGSVLENHSKCIKKHPRYHPKCL